jgi:hypothetical protein
LDKTLILAINLAIALSLATLSVFAPAIPDQDQATLAELTSLGDEWETTCLVEWRGEHGVEVALADRNALRAQLTMSALTRATLSRRVWDKTEWLVNEPWYCPNF